MCDRGMSWCDFNMAIIIRKFQFDQLSVKIEIPTGRHVTITYDGKPYIYLGLEVTSQSHDMVNDISIT